MTIEPVPAAAHEAATHGLIADRFEVESVLGRGGMGSVYRVRDRQNGRVLALKRLATERARNARMRSLFEREYTALARLAHPRIIEVHDYGIDASGPYYTMELLDGADMSALSPLPFEHACRYLREIATSLALLHARRLVHRDVTPRNVRMTHDDHCKLIDFGALATFGHTGAAVGTPPSMPPEALEGEPLDQRTDLFALGCVAYYMLTGRHAYPASHAQQLPSYWAQPLEPPSAVKPERDRDGALLPAIPPEVDELVLWLLRLDRKERPSSAGTVIDRLDVLLGSTGRDELDLAQSYLLSAPTIGREQPLGDARRCLDQLARGRGAALLFEGPSGSGKSRLLSEIVLDARLHGAAAVQVDGELHERPYATAYAVMRELLELVPQAALAAAAPHAEILGHVVPELLTTLRKPPAQQATDPLLWRSQVHAALRGFLLDLSRKVPLVLLIDNVQRCDHASAAVIATLAREAKRHSIVIAAGLRTEADVLAQAACNSLRQTARSYALLGLTADETRVWFEAVFGDAPNLPRLAQFLHGRVHGSPGGMMELLRVLVQRDELRYRDGVWVLPTEPTELGLPAHAQDIVHRRIAVLSDDARALARALCMYRGAMELELCRSLSGGMAEATLRTALDELVERSVLVLGRQGYAFTRDALREALDQELGSDERFALKRRIADAILSRKNPHVSERLEAGLHLLEAGDARGARLLSQGAVEVCLRSEGIDACARTLAAGLQKLRECDPSPYAAAPLLAALGLAAYMVDRRLDRYSDELVACYDDILGLRMARSLRPFVGKRASTLLGLAVAVLRYRLRPARDRHCSFARLVQVYLTAITALCGKHAICLDRPAIERLVAEIEPLTALGARHTTTFTYDYCRGLGMITGDRLARTYAHWLDLERRMHMDGALSELSREARRLFEGGVHYVLGVLEAFSCDPKVMARIKDLEESQLDIHALIAAQLRLQYHGFRGEADAVARATAQMEACAVQTGYSWQVEAWSAITINLFGGLWRDVLVTKRAMDESGRLAQEVRSLEYHAKNAKAIYVLERGQPRDAAKLLEDALANERPFERIGWCTMSGMLAESLNRLGEHRRAQQLCEDRLRERDPEDAVYGGLHLPLELALINALAGLGEFEQAEQRLQQAIAMHADRESPLILGTLHEAGALIAHARADRKAYSQHLKEVERHFCPLGNAALIARFRRLAALGGKDGDMSAKIASMREVNAFDSTLSNVSDRASAAHHIFTWLMQKCEGLHGYLLARDLNGLELLASSAGDDAPEEAAAIVQRSLESLGRDEATTRFGTEALTATDPEHPETEPLHVHLLSFVEANRFFGEGALILRGHSDRPPRIRYDLLQVAARHLHRLRDAAASSVGDDPQKRRDPA